MGLFWYPFWGSGDSLGRLLRAVPSKPPLLFQPCSLLGDFGGSKMELKSMKNRLKNLMKKMLGVGWVLGGCFVDFGGVFVTLDLQKLVCGVGEVLFF